MASLFIEFLYALVWLIELGIFVVSTSWLLLAVSKRFARMHAGTAPRYGEYRKERRAWLLLALGAMLWIVALTGVMSARILEFAPDEE
jgi:uncharacterized membrane protein YidH (DUF202 family)